MTGTAKKAGTATAAVPLSYSQLYEIVETRLQLTVEDFELSLDKDGNALDTDWSWHTSSPLTIYVSPSLFRMQRSSTNVMITVSPCLMLLSIVCMCALNQANVSTNMYSAHQQILAVHANIAHCDPLLLVVTTITTFSLHFDL
jgi:hypothetical protein